VTTTKIIVTVLGLVAIVWVNYWFFFSKSVQGEQREE
jgi:plastocyanin domain-containing protein